MRTLEQKLAGVTQKVKTEAHRANEAVAAALDAANADKTKLELTLQKAKDALKSQIVRSMATVTDLEGKHAAEREALELKIEEAVAQTKVTSVKIETLTQERQVLEVSLRETTEKRATDKRQMATESAGLEQTLLGEIATLTEKLAEATDELSARERSSQVLESQLNDSSKLADELELARLALEKLELEKTDLRNKISTAERAAVAATNDATSRIAEIQSALDAERKGAKKLDDSTKKTLAELDDAKKQLGDAKHALGDAKKAAEKSTETHLLATKKHETAFEEKLVMTKAELNKERDDVAAKLGVMTARVAGLEANIDELTKKLTDAEKAAAAAAETKLQASSGAAQASRAELDDANANLAKAKEALKAQIVRSAEAAKADVEATKKAVAKADAEAKKKTEAEAKEALQAQIKKATDLAKAKTKVESELDTLAELRDKVVSERDSLKLSLEALRVEMRVVTESLTTTQTKLITVTTTSDESTKKQDSLATRAAELEAQIEELSSALAAAKTDAEAAKNALSILVAEAAENARLAAEAEEEDNGIISAAEFEGVREKKLLGSQIDELTQKLTAAGEAAAAAAEKARTDAETKLAAKTAEVADLEREAGEKAKLQAEAVEQASRAELYDANATLAKAKEALKAQIVRSAEAAKADLETKKQTEADMQTLAAERDSLKSSMEVLRVEMLAVTERLTVTHTELIDVTAEREDSQSRYDSLSTRAAGLEAQIEELSTALTLAEEQAGALEAEKAETEAARAGKTLGGAIDDAALTDDDDAVEEIDDVPIEGPTETVAVAIATRDFSSQHETDELFNHRAELQQIRGQMSVLTARLLDLNKPIGVTEDDVAANDAARMRFGNGDGPMSLRRITEEWTDLSVEEQMNTSSSTDMAVDHKPAADALRLRCQVLVAKGKAARTRIAALESELAIATNDREAMDQWARAMQRRAVGADEARVSTMEEVRPCAFPKSRHTSLPIVRP